MERYVSPLFFFVPTLCGSGEGKEEEEEEGKNDEG